jgi:hypothetical protein
MGVAHDIKRRICGYIRHFISLTSRGAAVLSCFKNRIVLPGVVLGELEDGEAKDTNSPERGRRRQGLNSGISIISYNCRANVELDKFISKK